MFIQEEVWCQDRPRIPAVFNSWLLVCDSKSREHSAVMQHRAHPGHTHPGDLFHAAAQEAEENLESPSILAGIV